MLAMMEDKGVKCIHSPLESSRSTPEIDVLKHLGTSKLVLRQENDGQQLSKTDYSDHAFAGVWAV